MDPLLDEDRQMTNDLDRSPTGPHYATMKDGTVVFVGPANAQYAVLTEQLRVANMRIAIARRVLTGKFTSKTIETAIAGLDYAP